MVVFRTHAFNQQTPLRCVMGIARRKAECQCAFGRRGSHMNLRGEPPFERPIACSPLSLSAPVPSGCTFTEVLSMLTMLVLMSIMFRSCNAVKILSIVPFLLQRLNLVYMVCQFPNSFGNALHWQPCSATYKTPLRKSIVITSAGFLCTGKRSLIFSRCSRDNVSIALFYRIAFTYTRIIC